MKNFFIRMLLACSAMAFLLVLAEPLGFGQTKVKTITVSGYITDSSSGETLLGAGVECAKSGAVTNTFGFYTLTIPKGGEASLRYSYVGYSDKTIAIIADKDTTINVSLKPDASIQEATVTSKKESGISSTKMSAIEIPTSTIRNTPLLFGEADVLKTIQLMPGVQSGTEGFSGIHVRGGGPDENLLLLDGISIYNAEHMLGLFSIFPTESIKKVTLYKGSFPARYGGRTSSIIDVRTNDGNLNETHGCIGVGVLCDKIHLEGPIFKGKTSYSFSLRGMHTFMMDGLMRAFKVPANYCFYDLDAKVTHKFSDSDRIFVNVYNGRDIFHFDEDYESTGEEHWAYQDKIGIRWGNTLTAARWNHVFSGKLFCNTTVAYTGYKMKMEMDYIDKYKIDGGIKKYRYAFDYGSGMKDVTVKTDFDWTPSSTHTVRFGAEYVRHNYIPDTFAFVESESENGKTQTDTVFRNSSPVKNGDEASLFIEDDFTLGRFSLNPGIHFAVFRTSGKTYWAPEPRMNAKVDLGKEISLKAGYSRMSQYVHLLSSSQISLPIDLWVPITNNIKPVTSDQYSLGICYGGMTGWEFSLEGYWKSMHNILEYKDGVSFLANSTDWEKNVAMGDGRAYGAELFIQKTMGKTTGWLGYTLSWSDRIFRDGSINNGERYPYRYDRRHSISLVLNHKFTDKIDMGATWTFATGGTTTVPEREAVFQDPNGDFIQIDYYPHRNNYRLPPSHRLNLGVNFHKDLKHGESIWSVGVYNAYNRMNPNFVFYSANYDYDDGNIYKRKEKLKSVTILPIIPSVSYTWKF